MGPADVILLASHQRMGTHSERCGEGDSLEEHHSSSVRETGSLLGLGFPRGQGSHANYCADKSV